MPSRAPIPREKFETFRFELEKEMYNVLELTGLPGCSFVSVETPNSDSPKVRPAQSSHMRSRLTASCARKPSMQLTFQLLLFD